MVVSKYTRSKLKEVSAEDFLRDVFPPDSLRNDGEEIGGFGYGIVKVSSDGGATFRGYTKIISANRSLKILEQNTYWSDLRSYVHPKDRKSQIVDYRAMVISLDFENDVDAKRKEVFRMIRQRKIVKPTYLLVCGDDIRFVYLFKKRISRYAAAEPFFFTLYTRFCDALGTVPEGFDAHYLIPESVLFGDTCHAYRFGKKADVKELAEMVGLEVPKISERKNRGPSPLFAHVFNGWVNQMKDSSYVFTKLSAEVLYEIGRRTKTPEPEILEAIRFLSSGSSAVHKGSTGCPIPLLRKRRYWDASYKELKSLADIVFEPEEHEKRSDRSSEIEEWLKTHPTGTARQCEKDLGIPKSTADRYIRKIRTAAAELPFE